MNKIEENLVVKGNDLVVARYSMTLNEQRLLLACISQIDSRKKIENKQEFVLTVEQARDLFYSDGNQKNAYRDLKDASERLFERKVRIDLGNNQELLTRFVQSVKFDPDKSQVTLEFADKILPYLSQLEANFTKYRLRNIVQLTSSHAVRLYELIVSWAGQGLNFKEMTLDELRDMLSLGEKYKQFGQLHQKVIKPSIEQINRSTDFELKIDLLKYQRRYHSIQLFFERKPEATQEEKNRIEQKKRNIAAQQKRQAAAREILEKARQEAAENQYNALPDGTQLVSKDGVIFEKVGDSLMTPRTPDLRRGQTIPFQQAAKMLSRGDLTLLDASEAV